MLIHDGWVWQLVCILRPITSSAKNSNSVALFCVGDFFTVFLKADLGYCSTSAATQHDVTKSKLTNHLAYVASFDITG